jgi:23S rRNA pseudouridine1911/1915/1917 synthase
MTDLPAQAPAPKDGSYELPKGTGRKALDAAIREFFPGTSWGKARNLITTGKVKVADEVVLEPTRFVRPGDRIDIRLTAPRPSTQKRLGREVVAYVDPHVIVVRKPPGINTVPFDENETGTLDELVRAHLSRVERGRGGRVQGTLGVVHRLDKETSGLLVFARTLAAKKHLSQQFRVHTVHREYRAIVHGDIDDRTFRSRLVADRGDGLRGSTRSPTEGQLAVTHIARMERLGDSARATLIACRLETGRTHQIRIHLSESGHPLVGERVYIRRYNGRRVEAPRIMLHAAELGFIHPHTEEEIRFEEPLPDDMEKMLDRLRAPEEPASDEREAGTLADADEDDGDEDDA